MKALEYIKFARDFFLIRKDQPYILGLVITDICNLNCRHCRVANIYKQHMPYVDIETYLKKYYMLGARFLYLEGGEPYLWHDNNWRLADIVQLAKDIGYLRIHVYTNGTFPLSANPHFTWVGLDGLPETYPVIRGIPINGVLNNIRHADQKKIAIIFTVNTINFKDIREMLHFVNSQFPKIKVMFFFHTPYYGVDSLMLSDKEKEAAIQTIIACKHEGLPVLNSEAGLHAIASGQYNHPMKISWVIDKTGEYQCCRAYGKTEVCLNCGYSSGAEIALLRSFRFSVIKEALQWV